MPKVHSVSPITSKSTNGSSTVLKKNQACHQCRRRKLVRSFSIIGWDLVCDSCNFCVKKCDAKRPCSTCVRSHSHALAHPQEGVELPPEPDCTYDEASESSISASWVQASKNRYEHLENRILELEALLKEKDKVITSFVSDPLGPSMSQALLPSTASPSQDSSADPLIPSLPTKESFMGGPASLSEPSIIWPHWPRHLPRPDLLHHIVEAFFSFHPHASRLFNASNFLTSLLLPSDHPDFPSSPVLHAICAFASIYTVAARQQLGSPTTDFAQQQATHAKDQLEKLLVSGQKPLQCLQTTIILSWYYWSHARWIELFMSTGQSLRIAVPLGLNLCPPFHALNTTAKSMSIIPTPLTSVEDEMRRNAFWLAYAVDRQFGAGNGWALTLDDNDIAQLLPLPKGVLDAGIPVSAEHRQWSHLQESFLTHPPEITDSFTLYVKAMMIISRVKNFNHRFRVMEDLGDPGSKTTRMNRRNQPDIRATTMFSQLEDLVVSFRSSLTHKFKDSFTDDSMDTHLYTTHLALHASIILLHEPHSVVRSSICTSAMKILHAARAILDLVYAILSSNYDLGLLDLFCPFCWFLAGRVFVRFLKAAQDAQSFQQIETLQIELEFIRLALGRMGERVPLSARYQKMLDVCILEVCGEALASVCVPTNDMPVRTVADDPLLARVTQNPIPVNDLGAFSTLYDGFMEEPDQS